MEGQVATLEERLKRSEEARIRAEEERRRLEELVMGGGLSSSSSSSWSRGAGVVAAAVDRTRAARQYKHGDAEQQTSSTSAA